jgi:ubiquitin-activating enzyme E1 C
VTGTDVLYMQKPPSLEKATKHTLNKALKDLIQNGEQLTITDPMFPGTSLGLSISFEN